jgi:hypothetical protein
VARAEPREALAGPGVPVGACAEEGGGGGEVEDDAPVVEFEANLAELPSKRDRLRRGRGPRGRFARSGRGRPSAPFAREVRFAVGVRHADRSHPPRPLELLRGDHPFRELDELVPRLAGRCPQTQPADQAAAASPDLERKGVEPHDGLQRALLEDDGLPHSALLSRLGLPAVAIR